MMFHFLYLFMITCKSIDTLLNAPSTCISLLLLLLLLVLLLLFPCSATCRERIQRA